MSTDTMRPKKGDLYIELRNGDGIVRCRIEKAHITPEKKAMVDTLVRQFAEGLKALPRTEASHAV